MRRLVPTALLLLAGSGVLGDAASAGTVRVYSDALFATPFSKVMFGYDRNQTCTISGGVCSSDADCGGGLNDFCGVSLSSVVPGSPTNIWDLACAPSTPGGFDCDVHAWDFSVNNLTNFPAMLGTASTTVNIDATETCSFDKCGFAPPATNKVLGREDVDFAGSVVPTVNAIEFEDRSPGDHTIWLRATVRREGVATGGLGKNESRICYDQAGVPEVPLWQFPNCDGQGCYIQVDDSWEPELAGAPAAFDCDKTIFNQICSAGGGCGFGCEINAFADGSFAGKQTGRVFNEGTVTLPSGHTFPTLVTYTTADFNTNPFGSCPALLSQGVRTLVYLWTVPKLGTVVRLQSTTLADSVQDFGPGEDILSEIDVKFGLLPPLSVDILLVTDTTVKIEWDPGEITDHIDGYRVYWDTDSGSASSYAFDSVINTGQIFIDTSDPTKPNATISGLNPGTKYFITVTSASDFTDPASSVVTPYESMLFPEQIPAIPTDLPVEIRATTTGGAVSPSGAVPDGDDRPGTQLRLGRGAGTVLDLSWGASCVAGDDYAIYEGTLGDLASSIFRTCSTAWATSGSVAPYSGNKFYLVVPNSGLVEGSYGLSSAGAERATAAYPCCTQLLGAPVCP